VGTGQRADAGILPFKEAGKRKRFVAAAIIGDDEFKIELLRRAVAKRAYYRSREARLFVVCGNYDRKLHLRMRGWL
jgi:hypothetical protein